jgi:hypothetical protein
MLLDPRDRQPQAGKRSMNANATVRQSVAVFRVVTTNLEERNDSTSVAHGVSLPNLAVQNGVLLLGTVATLNP